jgi:hypothetical protein
LILHPLGKRCVRKLSPSEYAVALRQGRGTALMHVRAHGLDGIEELVLKACLEDQAYDAQCEGSRATWLYGMFKGAPQYDLFHRAIVAKLRDMSEEVSAEQVCELACSMARDGDDEAGEALRAFVWGQDFRGGDEVFEIFGCKAIASLDGMPAVVEIARRYGRILQDDPISFRDTLDELTDGADTYALAFAKLEQLAKTDSAIAAYVEGEQQEIDRRIRNDRQTPAELAARRELNSAEVLAKFPLAQVLAAAARHDRGRGPFMRFGLWSDYASLSVVLERLNVEPDVETCLRLLWVFHKAAPTYIPDRLWDLASHHDARIRDAALTALAHADDPAVAAFGRQSLGRGTFSAGDAATIELFTKHYKVGDENLIMDALSSLSPNENEAHFIGTSILAFCKHNNFPATADILNWVYSTNPCTICRGHAVELLIESKSLAADLAIECRFDASEEIQELVHLRPLAALP